MKKLYVSLLVLFSALHVSAQFSGAYVPANWTTVRSAFSNGTVSTSNAPASITITGSNDPSNPNSQTPVTTDFTIVATTSGIWKFDWVYHTDDQDPQYDAAGILIDGVFTPFIRNTLETDQDGTFTAPSVSAGSVIGFRIVSTDNSFGRATVTISDFRAPGSVTPVTLISFHAKSEAQAVKLQWKTADESKLSGYTVERSSDGIHFRAIATVQARNTPNLQTYEASDASPLSGSSYYRLRINELFGEDKYSAIVSVKREGTIRLQVYPNPVKDRLMVTVTSDRAGAKRLELTDVGGRIIHSKLYSLQEGQQTLTVDYLPQAKGVYYLRLENTVIPFVKE
jgi:hypothetical protein